LDDRRVPNSKNQINDYGKDMDMSYIKLMKKKKMEDGKGAHFGSPNEATQTK
jgi:hypothetical protein